MVNVTPNYVSAGLHFSFINNKKQKLTVELTLPYYTFHYFDPLYLHSYGKIFAEVYLLLATEKYVFN